MVSVRRPPRISRNMYTNVYKDTTNRFTAIWTVLLIWKGSVFKLLWHDVVIFFTGYALLSIFYRNVLFHYPAQRESFEMFCIYAERFSALIPISFLTGFYVSQVVTRWWTQFMSMPWPDKFAFKLVSYIPGTDPFRKNLRRTVMRYVNLSTVLAFRLVSLNVQERFPTYDELIKAKLMLPHEAKRLQGVDAKTPHEVTWAPILWACKLIERARTDGKIKIEPPVYANLISGVDYIEQCNRKLLSYGWVNFPLAYTQVASLSVLTYFVAALFGRQYLVPTENNGLDTTTFPHANLTFSNTPPFNKHTPDFYVPFFTFIEFISYMGWIKVAESLLNPFGDDEEDFEINYIIDRNLQVSYLIVDEAELEVEMADDPFLEAGITVPQDLPPYKEQRKAASRRESTVPNGENGMALPERLKDTFRSSMRSQVSKLSGSRTNTPKLNRSKFTDVAAAAAAAADDDDVDDSALYKTVNDDPEIGTASEEDRPKTSAGAGGGNINPNYLAPPDDNFVRGETEMEERSKL